mmetsp:Transcript_48797/g.156827  ORF Transcript_48797/g.156827 Transcript_48797/m.156827 type:complete len:261 (-) Transcript_48797:410-1192(-)
MGQSLGGSDVEALGCSRCGSRAAQVIVEACSSKKQAPETSSPPQVGGSTAAWVLEQPCGHVHSGIATGSLCGPPNNEGLACLPASLCLDAAPPLFEVPPEVDVYEEDGDKSRQALEHFMHTLADGVGLRLLLEGCGALHVKGSLDCETWVLRLAFNSIEKKVPLQRVRNVSLQEVHVGPREMGARGPGFTLYAVAGRFLGARGANWQLGIETALPHWRWPRPAMSSSSSRANSIAPSFSARMRGAHGRRCSFLTRSPSSS